MRLGRKARARSYKEVKRKLNTKALVCRDEGLLRTHTKVFEYLVVFSNDPYSFKLKWEQEGVAGGYKEYVPLSEDNVNQPVT